MTLCDYQTLHILKMESVQYNYVRSSDVKVVLPVEVAEVEVAEVVAEEVAWL